MHNLQLMGSLIVKFLVAFRKAQGITQRQVAEHMEVAQSTVSEFEHSDNPLISTLQRYARAVGLTLKLEIEKDEQATVE